MKKKILFVVEAMGGGVFTYIVDLANQLVENYDMYIAYAVRPQTPSNYKEHFDKRINLIEVKNFTRSINPVKDAKAFVEVKNLAKHIEPDVIHLHSSKAGIIGRWAFNGKKTPLFYTPHGYSFLMANYSKVKRTLFKMIEVVSAKRSCITISCSEGEHKETLKFTKRAMYVNNGINIKDLQKLIQNIDVQEHRQFTVFILGRICYQKNPELLNKIAEALPDIKFLWIGDGELRNKLTSPNIEITGWIDRELALKYSMEADAFILTSLWEGLPMSLLEAMYMKKLCIVSDVIGNHDVIHTGENGFVCKNELEFVEAIKSASNKEKNVMINKAYQDILNQYNTVAMARKYEEIYDKGLECCKLSGGVSNNLFSSFGL